MRYVKNLKSPFKVGDQAIQDDTEVMGQGENRKTVGKARLVTITAETATRYKAGKLEFDKTDWGDPKGRGNTRGSLRAITPELMEQVERTIREENKAITDAQSVKDCAASDEAEYLAWLETDEGREMERLQSDYFGAEIQTRERYHFMGRAYEVILIGAGGREVEKITVQQKAEANSDYTKEILERSEIMISSNRFTSGQATMFTCMMQRAIEIAIRWDYDQGKEWVKGEDGKPCFPRELQS